MQRRWQRTKGSRRSRLEIGKLEHPYSDRIRKQDVTVLEDHDAIWRMLEPRWFDLKTREKRFDQDVADVVAFADERSESVGESRSRVAIREHRSHPR